MEIENLLIGRINKNMGVSNSINSIDFKVNKLGYIQKLIVKSTAIGGLSFFLILQFYSAIILVINGIVVEVILPTVIFDIFLGAGAISFIIIAGNGQKGKFIEWLCYLVVITLLIYFWSWQINVLEIYSFKFSFGYFPISTLILWLWIILIIFSAIHLLGIGLITSIKILQNKNNFQLNSPKRKRFLTVLSVVIPIFLIIFAETAAVLYVNEGTIKRTLEIPDNNSNCSLSMWDIPKFDAQIDNTTEINLNKLSIDEKRILTAFGKMNTTFYYSFSIKTELSRNYSIAYLKMLDAYNLSLCWTIWYEKHQGFPTAAHPEDWISSARSKLEFVIDNNITNVIGISADSEGDVNLTAEEYWTNIGIYDDFLKEVQTNSSLAHPDPKRDTFETILTFEPSGLIDFMDGDEDLIYGQRKLGLPPSSWTKYHFMLYRMHNSANPTWLYNFLTLAKNHLGTDVAAPIVGLSGIQWFADDYFEGTNEHFHWKPTTFEYDGIDGWNAMKREILIGKAMGFETISVFHLNSYGNTSLIEGYGFLDYYGIDNIEELAEEWNEPKIISYPISSINFRISQQGFFEPNNEIPYDLLTNIEMILLQAIIFIGIALVVSINIKKKYSKSK